MTTQFQLDHIFILTDVGAPAADKLVDFGLVEGPGNTHPGQGTANRRFFFQNVMLELLWVADAEELKASDLSVLWHRRPPGWHREQPPAASPFGLCLRPGTTPTVDVPFPGWPYCPSYLPAPLQIWIGNNADELAEPFLFYLSFGKPKASPPGQRFQTVSRLSLTGPPGTPSETLTKTLAHDRTIEWISGNEPLMELGFDQESQGQTMDFRPHLPLRLCW